MKSPPTLFSPCAPIVHISEKLATKGVFPPPNTTKRLSCAFRAHLFDGICVPKELPQTLHRAEQMLGKKLPLSAAPSLRNCQQGGNRKPRGRRAEASNSTIMRKAAKNKNACIMVKEIRCVPARKVGIERRRNRPLRGNVLIRTEIVGKQRSFGFIVGSDYYGPV